jgi:hypothetical protein
MPIDPELWLQPIWEELQTACSDIGGRQPFSLRAPLDIEALIRFEYQPAPSRRCQTTGGGSGNLC